MKNTTTTKGSNNGTGETRMLSVRVPVKLSRQMQIAAAKRDISLQTLVAEALRAYLRTPLKGRAKS